MDIWELRLTKKNTRMGVRVKEDKVDSVKTSDIAADSERNVAAVQEVTNKVSKKKSVGRCIISET